MMVTNTEKIVEGNEDVNVTAEEVTNNQDNEMSNEEMAEQIAEELGLSPDEPITEKQIKQIKKIIDNMRTLVNTMEDVWKQTKKEFKITDEHMKELYNYNEQNREEMPEGLSEKEEEEWDHFNGLNNIDIDTVIKIFGEGHPIIGVSIEQTRDRLKDTIYDFFNWMCAVRDFNNADRGYRQLLEMSEQQELDQLVIMMEAEQDPEKKAQAQEALESYYSKKYLDFLKEPVSEMIIKSVINAFSDEKKIEYYLNRSKEKLQKGGFNPMFLLEISQFEKRYLQERYHALSNTFLLYFMSNIIYDNDRVQNGSRTAAIIMAMDSVIRNIYEQDKKDRVLNNIMDLLDQFIEEIYAKYYPDKTIPPREVCLEDTDEKKEGE